MKGLLTTRSASPIKGIDLPLFLLCAFCYFLSACSIPNLETNECIAARPAIREFYSYHFGNDQRFGPEDLAAREEFLTPELAERLRNVPPEIDPFTLTADTPKAFRLGECRTVEPERKASFDVVLFWKTDDRSEQSVVKAEAVKQNEKWLVNGVTAN